MSDVVNPNVEYQVSRHGTGKGAQNWIDSLRVYAKGGHGGNGIPKYGGVGGKGGDIIIKCSDTNEHKRPVETKHQKKLIEAPLKSLHDVFVREFFRDPARQKLKAGPGKDAQRHTLIGHYGRDKILKVIFAHF